MNSLYSARLKNVAALSLVFDSEFLFMSSLRSGYVGNMLQENLFSADPDAKFNLGFVFLLGYSQQMEFLVEILLSDKENESLTGGITWCALKRGGVTMSSVKAIALISEDIFFDEEKFLGKLESSLSKFGGENSGKIAFYAEKFGYRRFSIPYETDDVINMSVSKLLSEMEFSVTTDVTGPSPEINLPFFVGAEIIISRS